MFFSDMRMNQEPPASEEPQAKAEEQSESKFKYYQSMDNTGSSLVIEIPDGAKDLGTEGGFPPDDELNKVSIPHPILGWIPYKRWVAHRYGSEVVDQ